MAAKAECTVNTLPVHGQTVNIRGWAGRCRSGIFPFYCQITDENGDLMVAGCTMWVLSDLSCHSMLSENIPHLQLPSPEPDDAPLPRMKPIRAPEELLHTSRRVRYSEVDINGHLTNTRYIDWVCDLAGEDFHRDHPLRQLRIDYRAEIMPDEEVALAWALSPERLYCAAPGKFTAALMF